MKFTKGSVPWNKGIKGFRHSGTFKKGHGDLVPKESRVRAGLKMTNELHHKWKGDEVGYNALHAWIARHLGKPKKCENCGTPERESGRRYIEWANKSGLYLRLVSDWMGLCVPCHRVFDKHPFYAKR